jgi:hypothetical protein
MSNTRPANPSFAQLAISVFAAAELRRAEDDIRSFLRDGLGFTEVEITVDRDLSPDEWDALIARAPNPAHGNYDRPRAPGGRFVRAREG